MYNEQLEQLIDAALADGELTEKEKQVLFKKAQLLGIDLDEFEMVLDSRLVKLEKAEKEKAAESAPKSNKYGDVRKCPVCGAIIQAYQVKCPECGYEFSNVDANMSSQKLAEEIKKAQNEADKKQAIILFPIPNTKSDLLEFLTSLQPKMRDVTDPLSSAYFKKYQECITKAKVSFSNDSVIRPFIDSFETERKSLRKKQKIHGIKRWSSQHKIISFSIITVVILAIACAIYLISSELSKTEKTDYNLCNSAVKTALQSNDFATAEQLVEDFSNQLPDWTRGQSRRKQKKYDIIAGQINSLYCEIFSAYLETGQIENAKKMAKDWHDEFMYIKIYDYLLDNGMFEEADEYLYYNDLDKYYSYMRVCVKKMLEQGEKERARRFVNNKASFFMKEKKYGYEKYYIETVKKDFNDIITSYK